MPQKAKANKITRRTVFVVWPSHVCIGRHNMYVTGHLEVIYYMCFSVYKT